MQTVVPHKRKPSHSEIAWPAYQIWEAEGRPRNSALKHWLKAEAELSAQFCPSIAAKKHDQKPMSQRNRYGLILEGKQPTTPSPG
jgi:hypothetical protein